jgi:uncharacterized protein YgiM (DUF1202 family)
MFDREQQRDQDPALEAQSPQADVAPVAEQAGGNQAALSEQQGAQPAAPAAQPADAKRQPNLQQDRRQYYNIANQITSLMEGGTTKGDYASLTIVRDGGIISYGKHQSTLASGSLGDIVNAYLETAKGSTAATIRSYQARVARRDASLRDDKAFLDALRAAAKEQEMKDAQDMVFNQRYWKPAERAATNAGVVSPLGIALMYDTQIQGGLQVLLDRTRAVLGGNVGAKVGNKTISEQEFLRVFTQKRAERLEALAQAAEAKGERVRGNALRNSIYRCDGFLGLINANNLNVAGPDGKVQIKGPGGRNYTLQGFDQDEVANGRDGSSAPAAPGPQQSGQQGAQQGPAAPAADVIGVATVQATQLNVRRGPNTTSAAIGRLNKGAQVQVTGTEGEWLQIRYNNQQAYVHGGFTSMQAVAAPIGTASVTASVLNVRQGASATSAKLGTMRAGETVQVIGQQDKWLQIRYNGQLAFISGDFATFTPRPEALEAGPIEQSVGSAGPGDAAPAEQQQAAPAPQQAAPAPQQAAPAPQQAAPQERDAQQAAPNPAVIDVAIVTSATLNVRSGPGTTHAILGKLKANDKVDVTGRSGDWHQVLFEGKPAFVHSGHATLKSQMPPSAADMLQSINLALDKAPTRLKQLMELPVLNTTEMTEARALVKTLPAGDQGNFFEVLQAKAPYASQRDNQATLNGAKIETTSGNMCNLTSLAMCLQFLGVPNPHPGMQYEDALEKVRQDKKLPARTTADGWGGVAEAMGVTWGFLRSGGNLKLQRPFWETVVRPALRSGKSVMMSITGHIVRVQGVNDAGIVVDDPYGHAQLTGSGYRYLKRNEYGKHDTVGNDNVWSFQEMGNHASNWVAWFNK